MDSPEVAHDERVPRLRLVRGVVGQAEMPRRVVVPAVGLQEAVLIVGRRRRGAQSLSRTYWRPAMSFRALATAASLTV